LIQLIAGLEQPKIVANIAVKKHFIFGMCDERLIFSLYWSQSYRTLISLFFRFLLLTLAISKYRKYFLMLQTLKLNDEKWKNLCFTKKKVW
jgi:hypothetical protein